MSKKYSIELGDLAGLSEPATALINRISDAVGGVSKPWQIKRTAKAEAEAQKIAALAQIEITEIEERALKRMIKEQARDQENIESIAEKAIPHLNSDAKPEEELEEDFIRFFFEKARLITNEEMQHIWAKVLAGEANNKGSFSRRTIETISTLEKYDADLFTKFCRHCWTKQQIKFLSGTQLNVAVERELIPIVSSHDPLETLDPEIDLSFTELDHLKNIGLISFNPVGGLQIQKVPKNYKLVYGDIIVNFEFQSEKNNSLQIGQSALTKIGIEIASLTNAQPSKIIFEKQVQKFIDENIAISIPVDMKDKYSSLN